MHHKQLLLARRARSARIVRRREDPMTRILVTLMIACLATVAAPGQNKPAQAGPAAQDRQAQRAAELLLELQKHVYRARRDIPLVDCIVVEDGKLIEWHVYGKSMKKRPTVLRAGTVTQVSSVKVGDSSIEVFFATDTCSLTAVSARPLNTATASFQQLLETTSKAIAAIFEVIEPARGKSQ